MQNIHLIEKSAWYNRVPKNENQWTAGDWKVMPPLISKFKSREL